MPYLMIKVLTIRLLMISFVLNNWAQNDNSGDPDEMAYYEQSLLGLHSLGRYMFWTAGPKGL